MKASKIKKLPRSFYTRSLLTVAKELLGKILVKNTDGIYYAGRIIEVEAYDGLTDEAAHSFGGKTPRNEIMFGKGGFFYVYFTYGAHFCCNVVTGTEGTGTAVLIRAVEPAEGIDMMIKNRFGRELINEKEKYNLTSGPGKVCKAFDINRKHYGEDLTGNNIYLLDQPVISEENIVIAKRIGITRSVDLPWRFYIKDNPYISRK
jgi:DNA-3-methyladenine glycosylase